MKCNLTFAHTIFPHLHDQIEAISDRWSYSNRAHRDWIALNLKWSLFRRSIEFTNQALANFYETIRAEEITSSKVGWYLEDKQTVIDLHLFFEYYILVSRGLLDILGRFHQPLYPRPLDPSRGIKQLIGAQFDYFCKEENSDQLGISDLFKSESSWFDILREIRTTLSHYDAPLINVQRTGDNTADLFVNFKTGGREEKCLRMSEVASSSTEGIDRFIQKFENIYVGLIKQGISPPKEAMKSQA